MTNLLRDVGHIVVLWALLEMLLSRANSISYKLLGNTEIKGALDNPLERKVSYLRACLSEKSSMSDFKEQGLKLLDRIDALSDTRHTIVHGALGHLLGSPASTTFTRLRKLKGEDILTVVKSSLTLEQLADSVLKVNALTKDFARFTVDLHKRCIVPSMSKD